MSWQATNWAVAQSAGGPGPKIILLLLADKADERHECFPGQESLAAKSEQSVSTVRRQLKALETLGLLRRERRTRANGSRTSDRYVLAVDQPTGQSDRLDSEPSEATGQMRAPTGQTEGSYRSPVVGPEPSVKPPVVEPSVAHAAVASMPGPVNLSNDDEPMLAVVVEHPTVIKPTAQHLVAAFLDGYHEAKDRDLDAALLRQLAGRAKQVANTRDTTESWRWAWQAFLSAGRDGRIHAISDYLAANTPPPSRRANHDLIALRNSATGLPPAQISDPSIAAAFNLFSMIDNQPAALTSGGTT